MTPSVDRIRPPVKVHGGKSYLARRIVNLFPDGVRYYGEPYAHGLSVMLACPRFAGGELANDLNPCVAAMWQAIRDRPTELVGRLMATPYSEDSFERSKEWIDHRTHVESFEDMAYHWIVRGRMSRGGLGNSFSWSDRERGGQPGDVNAWLTFLWTVPTLSARVQGLKIVNKHALEVIKDCDGRSTLLYCDPTYLPSTRTARKAYGPFEMSFEDHLELLAVLRRCVCRVVLSGYDSALYRSALSDWRVARFDIANHSSQSATKERRVECCWMNY
jgi:DNA adenine methylase